MFVCMCICMLGYMCRGMPAYGTCVHKGPSQPQVSFLRCHPHRLFVCLFVCLRQGLSLIWGLSGSLNWLGSEPQEYLSLPSTPGAGITSVCLGTHISYITVGSKVRSSCLQSNQVLYQLTYLLIP